MAAALVVVVAHCRSGARRVRALLGSARWLTTKFWIAAATSAGQRLGRAAGRLTGVLKSTIARIRHIWATRLARREASASERAGRPRFTAAMLVPASLRTWIHRRLDAEPNVTRRVKIAIVAVVAIVIVGVVAVVSRLWLVSTTPAVTSYAFAPASYQSGLVVNRTWALAGKGGDELYANVILVNSVNVPISGSYDEVIPKTVAGSDSAITFAPPPTKIVNADPVVRYDYDLTPGESYAISYSVDIGAAAGSGKTRLQSLAADQAAAQNAYLNKSGESAPVTLAQILVHPPTLSLALGQSTTATVTGVMSDGSAATPAVLGGVLWSSADRDVASVQGAIITATGAGSTTVSAQAGGLKAAVVVSVAPTSSSGGSVPSSPGTSRQPVGPPSTAHSSSARTSANPTPTSPQTSAAQTTSATGHHTDDRSEHRDVCFNGADVQRHRRQPDRTAPVVAPRTRTLTRASRSTNEPRPLHV